MRSVTPPSIVPVLALCVALCALCSVPAQAQAQAQGAPASELVGVKLELSQEFFYAGEPLWVRVTVRNAGDQSLTNPVPALVPGFRASPVAGGKLAAAPKPGVSEPTRPESLAARSFYGAVFDLARIYPGLGEVGAYTIHWSGGGLLSEQLSLRVIPRYSPDKQYRGEIETSAGTISLNFFPGQSPIATKAFIDMANAGFYDGLVFHEVQADSFAAGGNPGFGAGGERRPVTYPAEQSTLPLVSGTIIMKPIGASPPTNGPEFVILLRPQPAWAGQVTVLGQVVKGFDVVQAISRVPTTGQNERPFHKPLKDVTIKMIKIFELPATGSAK